MTVPALHSGNTRPQTRQCCMFKGEKVWVQPHLLLWRVQSLTGGQTLHAALKLMLCNPKLRQSIPYNMYAYARGLSGLLPTPKPSDGRSGTLSFSHRHSALSAPMGVLHVLQRTDCFWCTFMYFACCKINTVVKVIVKSYFYGNKKCAALASCNKDQ